MNVYIFISKYCLALIGVNALIIDITVLTSLSQQWLINDIVVSNLHATCYTRSHDV